MANFRIVGEKLTAKQRICHKQSSMSIKIYVVRRFRTRLPAKKKKRNVNKQDELVLQFNVTVREASGDMQHATNRG